MDKTRFLYCLLIVLFTAVSCSASIFSSSSEAQESEIRLIIRGDDIGSSHAANVGCIQSYRDGIMRSVEVMVPCPWFFEAAHFCQDKSGLDIGVHLTFTSEWKRYKWGTVVSKDMVGSFFDPNGYMNPDIMIFLKLETRCYRALYSRCSAARRNENNF